MLCDAPEFLSPARLVFLFLLILSSWATLSLSDEEHEPSTTISVIWNLVGSTQTQEMFPLLTFPIITSDIVLSFLKC